MFVDSLTEHISSSHLCSKLSAKFLTRFEDVLSNLNGFDENHVIT